MANDLGLALPESVTVAFPCLAAGGEDSPCAFYTVTLASLNLPGLYGVSGFPGSKIFRSSAVAGYGSPPANDTELRALATQIATDFYLYMLAPCDISFAGVVDWEPEGLTDWLEVVQASGRITTRVRRGPWLNHAGELLHWGSYGSADDAPPSPVKIINATPTADGYYQAVLVYWDGAGAAWRNVPTEAPVPAFGDPAFSLGVPVYVRASANNPVAFGTTAVPPIPAGTVFPAALPQEVHPGDGIPVYVAPLTVPTSHVRVTSGAVVDGLYWPGALYTYDPGGVGDISPLVPVWVQFPGSTGTDPTAIGAAIPVEVDKVYPAVYSGVRPADGLPVMAVKVAAPGSGGLVIGDGDQFLGRGIRRVNLLGILDQAGSNFGYWNYSALKMFLTKLPVVSGLVDPATLGTLSVGAIEVRDGLPAADLTGVVNGGTF